MLEFDETNNIGRILVTIEKDDPPPPPQEGFFAWLRALIQQFIDLILSIFGGGNPVPLPEGKGLHIAL